jgi:hypothetical protein
MSAGVAVAAPTVGVVATCIAMGILVWIERLAIGLACRQTAPLATSRRPPITPQASFLFINVE